MAILGDNSTPIGQTSGNLDRIYLNQYTVSGGAFTITKLHVNLNGTGAFRLVVYASNGPSSGPGTLVCYTADLTGPGGTVTDMNAIPNTPTTLTNGASYWIGLHFGNNAIALGTNGTGKTLNYVVGATFASGAPATFSTTPTSGNMQITVWLEGTTGGGGGGAGSILERKAGAASVDCDDYNALVDAVVALGGAVSTRKAGSGQVNPLDFNAVVDAVVALGGNVRTRKAGSGAVNPDDFNAVVDAVKLLGAP